MTIVTKEEGKRKLPLDKPRLSKFIDLITKDYPHLDVESYKEDCLWSVEGKREIKASNVTNTLVMNALDNIGTDEGEHPDWTYVAAEALRRSLYKRASRTRSYDSSLQYGDFYGLIKKLSSIGIYDTRLLRDYTKEEIKELGGIIDAEKDKLLTYIALRTLHERYLATDTELNVYELPQERFLVIAMTIMRKENRKHRLNLVKEAYWALSNLYMTVATPTLANAGKRVGQLSSCFIDTVEDSIEGIYNSNTDVARLSKAGGGIGVYLGFIRSKGSDIKGFPNASSGIVPWARQLNNTAVSVDQLGTRKGAIAVYLDVWHKDIFSFLDGKLNNGDERLRFHDLFTGVCIPDLFMEKVEKREDWYLFDPHVVHAKKGWYLQDFYDEKVGSGSFRERYEELVNDNDIPKVRVAAIEIMKRIMISQLEAGTPYMFYRDEVNRKNPNKHAGMIYCSNLCTEITQNQSYTTMTEEMTEDGKLITVKEMGDFVVCNLSSIHLGRAVGKDDSEDILSRLIRIQVRMLDNVIDLNTIEVLQAVYTNMKYRAIGLGTYSWHHLLALRGIKWESEQAVEYADELYERINYLTIQASCELAIEKGAYPMFKGSDWSTGEYFVQRGYIKLNEFEVYENNSELDWLSLMQKVATYGLRNGYLLAVAPNGTTSIIGNGSASIDPIFKRKYSEEKKDFKVPVTAPDLSAKTFWYYKNAYQLDQLWSIKQNAARQRHIDQAQSFNIYVENDVKAVELLNIHLEAWKARLKTTYYIRSTGYTIDECESCHS